jgi:uncharacterized membrane protein
MLDVLHEFFSSLCGQNLAHTWSPGGEALPCCQRCTGVYVGALVAALAHLAARPQPTSFWRWLNGAFLLFMIPAGFHWLPQGPELRAASGIVFGFGLVAFLWLPLQTNILPDAEVKNSPARLFVFYTALIATIVGTPLLGESENLFAGATLALLTAGGALALGLLLAANLFLAARELWRWFFRPARRAAA